MPVWRRAPRKFSWSRPFLGDAIAHGRVQYAGKGGNLFLDFMPALRGQLGGGSRCGGTQICHKVDDGGVRFVAYAADDGQAAAGDCACHDFFIEGPQVFNAAATADKQQYIALVALPCIWAIPAAAVSPCTCVG